MTELAGKLMVAGGGEIESPRSTRAEAESPALGEGPQAEGGRWAAPVLVGTPGW